MTTLAIVGSQELPYSGKRGLRGDIAAREADQAELLLERARLGVVAAVKRAYSGLVLSRELLDLVREQEQVWKEIEGVARARYAVGQGVQPDVLRVQVEVTRVEQLATEQQAETEIRVAELNRLLGRPATSPVETRPGWRFARSRGPGRRVGAPPPRQPRAQERGRRPGARLPAGSARQQGVQAGLQRAGRLHEPRRPRPDVAGRRGRHAAPLPQAALERTGRGGGAGPGERALAESVGLSFAFGRRSVWPSSRPPEDHEALRPGDHPSGPHVGRCGGRQLSDGQGSVHRRARGPHHALQRPRHPPRPAGQPRADPRQSGGGQPRGDLEHGPGRRDGDGARGRPGLAGATRMAGWVGRSMR